MVDEGAGGGNEGGGGEMGQTADPVGRCRRDARGGRRRSPLGRAPRVAGAWPLTSPPTPPHPPHAPSLCCGSSSPATRPVHAGGRATRVQFQFSTAPALHNW